MKKQKKLIPFAYIIWVSKILILMGLLVTANIGCGCGNNGKSNSNAYSSNTADSSNNADSGNNTDSGNFDGIIDDEIIDGEEILLNDEFPGFAEEDDWDDHWTTGVGGLVYNAGAPGFVRLLLDGPGVGGTYHNAEKKHYGESTEGFLYCDLEIRLRNSNNNGWDAPGAPGSSDSTYGLGSRGWGFWNGQSTLSGGNIIWFTSISPESNSQVRGTRVWIIRDGTVVLMQDLGIDLTQWHTYYIQWHPDYVGIFIDDMNTPIVELVDPNSIPNRNLPFTIWIDNYRLLGDMTNLIITYLPIPNIDQYIDVDYVKIHVP